MKAPTPDELLRFFYEVKTRASALADRRDPERLRGDEVTRMLDGLARQADGAWWYVNAAKLAAKDKGPKR